MKIYFTGSHGSGKSSLSRYVAEKYQLPRISEVARSVLSERETNLNSLRSNIESIDSYQSEVFYRQLKEEKKYNTFVSDRSIFDCLAYSAENSTILHNLMTSQELKDYLIPFNDPDNRPIVFFVRPFNITVNLEDGVRENTNRDGIMTIDAMIKLLLQMFNVRYISIANDGMQERIRLIDTVISLVK